MEWSQGLPLFSSFELFTNIFTVFDELLTDWLDSVLQNVIGSILDVALLMFTIYIILWGFAMLRGLIEEPVTDGLFRLLKVAIALGLALNVDLYRDYVVDGVQQIPMQLAFVMGGGTVGELADPDSPFQYGVVIDDQVQRVIDMAISIKDEGAGIRGGIRTGLKWQFVGGMTLVFGLLIFIISSLLIVMATVSTAVLLAVGPLFLLFAVFDKTSFLFEGWLRQTIMFMLRLFFVVLIAGLFFQIMERFIVYSEDLLTLREIYLAGITVGIVSLVLCLLLAQTSELASGISGGVALSASSGAAKLFRGAAVGKVLSMGGTGVPGASTKNVVQATRKRFGT